MARRTRPSDVYRLPEHQRSAPAVEAPEHRPRRFPLWIGVAGLLAVVLVASGLLRGSGTTMTGDAPIVDIVSEDQAIAALALYGAQSAAIEELQRRRDIFANPGPRDAALAARRGAEQAQRTLTQARKVPGADPLAARYYNAGDHARVVRALEGLRDAAGLIALLAATHDTLYSGSGSIELPVAYEQLTGAFSDSRHHRVLTDWAAALIEQMEDRDRVAQAAAARAATGDLWAGAVGQLQPAAVRALRDYVEGLPPVTVEGLRGHPIAGPALRHLERDERLVSLTR